MDNQIQNQKPTDEIDLIELFNRIGRGLKSMFYWIINLIKLFLILLIRKSLWIISFSIIGGVIGYTLYNSTPRIYTSEMVARSNSMNNSVIVNSINLLNNLIGNPEALSGYLNINHEQAKSIKSIESFYGIDINKDNITDYIDYNNIYNPKDTTQKRLPDIFYLRIRVFDETIFPSVRDGIKAYISNNAYIIKNNLIRKQQANKLIEAYNKEIQKIDSSQKVQYFEVARMQKTSNSQTLVLNEKENKQQYLNEILLLFTKKQEIEKDMILNPDPITVIQDFTQLSKAVNPLVEFYKLWVSLFAAIGFFISIGWQYREKIWKLIKNRHY